MRRIETVLAEYVDQKRIPSFSVCVRVDAREVFHTTIGRARYAPERPASEDQPYDCASVTKALAGATVTAALLERGKLQLDEPVAKHVPDVDPRVTLRHLLTHTSGYPWWRPLYEQAYDAWGLGETRRHLLRAARTLPLETVPGEAHAYSDIGFLVLLQLLEEVGEDRFDALFQRLVADPSGLDDLHWGWPGAAATEQCPVRGVLVEGTVHDLNCAALGGVSTHAGLFAPARTACELADRLMHAVLEPSAHPDLPGRGLALLWEARGKGSHVGGWDSVSTEGYTSTGKHFPRDARGHLGYTGTAVWCVPSKRTTVTVFSNRVHPNDDKETIREARPRIHDAIAEALGWAS